MIVFRVLQISGGLTLVLLAGFVIFFIRTDPNRRHRAKLDQFIGSRMSGNARFAHGKQNHGIRRGD
jgi:hypothetical protein